MLRIHTNDNKDYFTFFISTNGKESISFFDANSKTSVNLSIKELNYIRNVKEEDRTLLF